MMVTLEMVIVVHVIMMEGGGDPFAVVLVVWQPLRTAHSYYLGRIAHGLCRLYQLMIGIHQDSPFLLIVWESC